MTKTNQTAARQYGKVTITEPTELARFLWDPRYPPDQRREFVDQYKDAFKESGNVLLVWAAIRTCLLRLDEQPREPLPDWVCDYLAEVSVNLGWLELGLDFSRPGGHGFTAARNRAFVPMGRASAARARDLLPRALGLTRRPGSSAFADAQFLGRDFLLYRHYLALLERSDMRKGAALQSLVRQAPGEEPDGIPRVLSGPGGSPLFGFDDVRSARRFVARMRRRYPSLKPDFARLRRA